jgi:hypothetical protein
MREKIKERANQVFQTIWNIAEKLPKKSGNRPFLNEYMPC